MGYIVETTHKGRKEFSVFRKKKTAQDYAESLDKKYRIVKYNRGK